ncbi:MAG: DegT/DnrJ/EryC1/StrS family aminotransferase [Candidatus Sulfotelmatobacter sp.]
MTASITKPKPAKPQGQTAPGAKPTDSVPMLDLRRQYLKIRSEILAAIENVCASQQYILGPEVEAFEREAADFCGTRDAVGCASGTDALWLALAAAGVQPGDQVLTTPFSFFASASAIVRAGARPVLIDIDPVTFNLNPAQVEIFLRSSVRDKLRAMLPVHLYGQCADMSRLQLLAAEFHLALIEDAAQAIGASWGDERNKGRRAGSLGVSAAFSFYPTKNLSAYGEAGLITTDNPEMAAQMRLLRNHGSPRRYLHEEFGWNSRMDAIQAAILRVKLKYVEEWNNDRRRRAATYDRLFAEAGLARAASSIDQRSTNNVIPDDFPIRLPHTVPQAHHIFHQYVVRAYRRDELREFLTARKIGTEVYYPIPLHLQPYFVYLGYREGDFPEAERASKEVLALPMFPELTEDEQRWVVQSVADFYC